MNTEDWKIVNEKSHYRSLQKTDIEHRKLIKKLQAEIKTLKQALNLGVVSRSEPKDTKIVLGFSPESYWGKEYYKQFKKAQDELKDLNQTIEDKTLS